MTSNSGNSLVLGLFLVFGGLHAPAALAADDHAAAHRHDSHAAPKGLVLNNGKKWNTDEPLRRGMGNIRALVERHHHATHGGKPVAAAYDKLAKGIQAETTYIFQNCKLDKQADEVLHVVLTEVLGGAAAIEGKQKGASRDQGVTRVVGALNDYGRTFNHPGWKPVK